MNQEPLDEMIRSAVDRALNSGCELDADALLSCVLEDPDITIYMRGISDHDRSGDLPDIYTRDIRQRIQRDIERRSGREHP